MEPTIGHRTHLNRHLRFIAGVCLTIAVALGAFLVLMRPPMGELRLMALFLAITAVISVGVGYGAYRLGWMNHSPRISWVVLGGYALSS